MADFTNLGEGQIEDLRSNVQFLGKLQSASRLAESPGAQGIRLGGMRGTEAAALEEVAGKVGLPQDLNLVLAQNRALEAAGGRGFTGRYAAYGSPRSTFADIQQSIQQGDRPEEAIIATPETQDTLSDGGSETSASDFDTSAGGMMMRSAAGEQLKGIGKTAAKAGASLGAATGTVGGVLAGAAATLSPTALAIANLPGALHQSITQNELNEALRDRGIDPESQEAKDIATQVQGIQSDFPGYGEQEPQTNLMGANLGSMYGRAKEVAGLGTKGFDTGQDVVHATEEMEMGASMAGGGREAATQFAAAIPASPGLTSRATAYLPSGITAPFGYKKKANVREMLATMGGLDDTMGIGLGSDAGTPGAIGGVPEAVASGDISQFSETLGAIGNLGATAGYEGSVRQGQDVFAAEQAEIAQAQEAAARQAEIESFRAQQPRGWTTSEGGGEGRDATEGLGGDVGPDADMGETGESPW